MIDINRILAAVDFSPSSEPVIEAGLYFATRVAATVDVLHVWEEPPAASPEVGVAAAAPRGLDEFVEHEIHQQLNRLFALEEVADHPQFFKYIEAGDPAQVIVEFARRNHHDLIIMGTQGRTGLSHLIMGSVTKQVIRHAPCPVLTVPAREPRPR